MATGTQYPVRICPLVTVVVEVLKERDDEVGKEIAGKVTDIQVDWSEWVQEILTYLDKRVHVVVDLREDPNAMEEIREKCNRIRNYT